MALKLSLDLARSRNLLPCNVGKFSRWPFRDLLMRPFHLKRTRSLYVAFTCLGVVLFCNDAVAEIEPYEARVTTPRTLVHSGPGEKFYPTRALSPGDTVEVYREEAGGWLGIRPPKDSFSWVSEKQLKRQDGNLAEIREDNAASRIGSELSDKRNAVQVRLKQGEGVEILGQDSIEGETWFKIAPPAGEFRWIHAASVERRGSISESAPAEESEPAVISASATSESVAIKSEANSASANPPVAGTPATSGETWRSPPPGRAPASAGATTSQMTAPPLAPLADAVPITSAPASAAATPAAAPSTAPATAAAPSVPPMPAAPQPLAGASDVSRQLTEIEMRLSRMASAPPQLWNTERLQRDSEQLLAQAQTQADRDAVKATMAKIDQFTTLARRYQQAPTNVAAAGQPVSPVADAAPGAPADAGRYDAVGILRPVVSKRPGAPQFALVDERGQVATFVTPSPDVNLQPYLGRRVGIAGNRGFIPEFNRAHVTAGRVTPLAERMVR